MPFNKGNKGAKGAWASRSKGKGEYASKVDDKSAKAGKAWMLKGSNLYIKFGLRHYPDEKGNFTTMDPDAKVLLSKLSGLNTELAHRPGVWLGETCATLLAFLQALEKTGLSSVKPTKVLNPEDITKVQKLLHELEPALTYLNGASDMSRTSKDIEEHVSKLLQGMEKFKDLRKTIARLMGFGARLYIGSFSLLEATAAAMKTKHLPRCFEKQPYHQEPEVDKKLLDKFSAKPSLKTLGKLLAAAAEMQYSRRSRKSKRSDYESDAEADAGKATSESGSSPSQARKSKKTKKPKKTKKGQKSKKSKTNKSSSSSSSSSSSNSDSEADSAGSTPQGKKGKKRAAPELPATPPARRKARKSPVKSRSSPDHPKIISEITGDDELIYGWSAEENMGYVKGEDGSWSISQFYPMEGSGWLQMSRETGEYCPV
jgi:hypothetical protein